MSPTNGSGMDMPQENNSNFQDSTFINSDYLKYLSLSEDGVKIDIEAHIQKLVEARQKRNLVFNKISECLDRLDNFTRRMLLIDLQLEFKVGSFYSFTTVEKKLTKIYKEYDQKVKHDTDELFFDVSAVKVEDLANNNWFKYIRTKKRLKGKSVDGIQITEILIRD